MQSAAAAVDPEAGNRMPMLRFRNNNKNDAVEPTPSPQPTPAAKANTKKTVPRWLANAKRSNFWSIKTRPPQWATVRSRWRFFEGLFFYLGPPLHMLRRVWPPMILNACVFALVAADHMLEAVSIARLQQQQQQQHGMTTTTTTTTATPPPPPRSNDPMGRRRLLQATGHSPPSSSSAAAMTMVPRSLFPPLSASVAASLEPVFRLSIFVVSLLLTLRVGRAYDRWWQARSSYQQLGSLALTLTQRAEAWFCSPEDDGDDDEGDDEGEGESVGGGEKGAERTRARNRHHRHHHRPSLVLAEDIARWACVWQCSVLQLVTGAPKLHPAARKLLKPAELGLYDASPKGRQLAASRMTELLVNGPRLARCRRVSELNAVTVDILVRAGLAAAGGCTSIKLQCLPAAVTITSTGVTEAFLLLYPLSALSVGSGGGAGHDSSVESVVFTLAIQFLLYLFVCLLFLGLAEVAGSLEDPFVGGHLPLEDMTRATIRDVANARREAALVRRLGLGGEGGRGGSGKGGDNGDEVDDDVEVFETVDWAGAVALCKRVS